MRSFLHKLLFFVLQMAALFTVVALFTSAIVFIGR